MTDLMSGSLLDEVRQLIDVARAPAADAVNAEGSVERVSVLFDVSRAVVRDAVNFEKRLLAS